MKMKVDEGGEGEDGDDGNEGGVDVEEWVGRVGEMRGGRVGREEGEGSC